MVFYYTETIDELFHGIQELIEIPINNIIIESRRREVRRYIEGMFPREITELLKIGITNIPDFLERGKRYNLQVDMIAKLYGYGDFHPSEDWENNHPYPWRSQIYRNPYSLLFGMADTLGTVEAIEGTDLWVENEKLSDNSYRITALEGEHPLELQKRLRRRRYNFKPGDLSFQRCSSCDTPMEISRCHWDLNEGIISDPSNGRRMALFGSAAMDAIFDDLEAELGKTIPDLSIEAQRRLVKSLPARRELAEERLDLQVDGRHAGVGQPDAVHRRQAGARADHPELLPAPAHDRVHPGRGGAGPGRQELDLRLGTLARRRPVHLGENLTGPAAGLTPGSRLIKVETSI